MFSPIPDILDDLARGRMIVLTDDENRENEGDLVLPAQFATTEHVNFMITAARGYLCLALTEADCDRLDLPPQSPVNTTLRGTAFTVSIDGHPRHGFTTGVSAAERARCIRMAIDPAYGPGDFTRPGHINPLRSRDGGVLVRTGQTEGSVDLCRLAGLYPAAAIIEIMREDGEMARVPDLEKFCGRYKIRMCSVAQIIEHRLARESLVRRLDPPEGAPVRTAEGDFRLFAFESLVDPMAHVALACGDVGGIGGGRDDRPTLVRMHRSSFLGDVFGDAASVQDPAGPRSSADVLRSSMRLIRKEGRGVVVYLRHEGTGDGLSQRLMRIRRDARHDPDAPNLSSPATERYIGIGSQILRDLGITKIRLLTNHATSLPGLDAYGLEVVERIAIPSI